MPIRNLFNMPIYSGGVQVAGPGTQQQNYLNHMASTNTPVGSNAYDPANWARSSTKSPAPAGWNQAQWDALTAQQQQRVMTSSHWNPQGSKSPTPPAPQPASQPYTGWTGSPVIGPTPSPSPQFTFGPSSDPAGTIGGVQNFGPQTPAPAPAPAPAPVQPPAPAAKPTTPGPSPMSNYMMTQRNFMKGNVAPLGSSKIATRRGWGGAYFA